MEDQDCLMELNSNPESGGGSFLLNICDTIWCHKPHNYTSGKKLKFCIFFIILMSINVSTNMDICTLFYVLCRDW